MSPFIEPSAAGPSQKLVNDPDGTVHVLPGKAHEAKEGSVSNPGVRTVSPATSGPRCPQCGESTLKMDTNKPEGQRIFCSNSSCGYKQGGGSMPVQNPSQRVTTTNSRGINDTGVKIVKQAGPR